MSNYLAIATVTAALQHLLQEGIREDVPGAIVTTVRPDHQVATSQTVGINIYLYQATPNPAWRNADLRTRRPKGDLIKHGQAGLDLHYLFTFYGNEQELEPQRLLGSTIRTLVDQPTLTQDMIEETIRHSSLPFLSESTLGDQVQLVQFIPSTITTEDLSRIWSVFFQVPYSLSFAFQGTAVLIQGDSPGKTALPVRKRQFFLSTSRPILDKIEFEKPLSRPTEEVESREPEPLTRSSDLIIIIRGRRLQGEQTLIRIGGCEIMPQKVTDDEVRFQLSALSRQEAQHLKAGMQGVQIVHQSLPSLNNTAPDVESNVLPLVLNPAIFGGSRGISMSNLSEQNENIYQGNMIVQIDVAITPEQRVYALLNGVNTGKTYIFRAARRDNNTTEITFPFEQMFAGEYLVRVQVDGAESPLTLNADGEYSEPVLVIP